MRVLVALSLLLTTTPFAEARNVLDTHFAYRALANDGCFERTY